ESITRDRSNPAALFPLPRVEGRILLAEDNPVNQRLISTLLSRAGAVVDVVENGSLAMQKVMAGPPGSTGEPAARNHAAYDLVLMDMQMPVMDGCTATRKLREHGLTLPILALTANAMEEDRAQCLAAGCDDFFTKPLDRDQLVKSCCEWIRRTRSAVPLHTEREIALTSGAAQPVDEVEDVALPAED
ncbi:MAG: response regulator, partial [Planctomycetaceae bacterium]|nr:response regulator [Planctomycetaceae bacterium]